MQVRNLLCGAALLGLALATSPAAAQAADPVVEAAEFAGEVLFLESGAPGMVMVIVRNGKAKVFGFGETAKGNGKQPDGQSLFRLNSISKVFVGEVAGSLAADGKLRLTDPLQNYAGSTKVPALGERQITLLDLATHSAAMPREMPGAPEGMNPRAWPRVQTAGSGCRRKSCHGRRAASPPTPTSASIFWPMPPKPQAACPIQSC